MKRFIVLIVVIIVAVGCRKDLTNSTDITQFSWQIKSFTDEGDKSRTPTKNYHGSPIESNQYILTFLSDTAFSLPLGDNFAHGGIEIPSEGAISFNTPTIITERCCDSDFDIQLIETFGKISEYKVLGNYLFFKGENCEIKLKKVN